MRAARRDPPVRAATPPRQLSRATAVLGVDLAAVRWRDNGSALVSFDAAGWRSVETGVVEWPRTGSPTADAVADLVDRVALEREVAAVGIDGPQGWRDPDAPLERGVGRACEREAATQGKAGPRGVAYPPSQRRWFELAVDVFERLLARPHVEHANDADPGLRGRAGTYVVAEVYPTSTWRTAGLRPLPGKRARPDVPGYTRQLAARFGLPLASCVGSHDDLQALVAALPAAAVVGGPATAIARGVPARRTVEGWIEGLIWDAAPAPTVDVVPVDKVSLRVVESCRGDPP